jgi:hypothetical protein
VSFKVNNKTYKGYARLIDKSKEPILANAVSALMLSKYGWNDGLIVELTPMRITKNIINNRIVKL